MTALALDPGALVARPVVPARTEDAAALEARLLDAVQTVWEWQDQGLFALAPTPLARAGRLSERLGCDLRVKLETLQHSGAFKERGALAKLLSLDAAERRAGVAAASAGNHAQGLARHAARLGVRAVIVMPEATPRVKVERTRAAGADVVLAGADFEAAEAAARALADRGGLTLVHPFDDPWVIAGQSTLGREVLLAEPELDAMVVPAGGGGLLTGVALAAKVLGRDVALYGVRNARLDEPAGGCGCSCGPTLAEGIAVRRQGRHARAFLHARIAGWLSVTEAEIANGIRLYLSEMGQLAEGAGAAGLAAIARDPERFEGKRVATILSGGNIDPERLGAVLAGGAAR